MRFDSKISDDDAQFVDATLDEGKRQERIERLSGARRKTYIVLIVEGVCVILMMLIDLISRIALGNPNAYTMPSIFAWGVFFLIFAMYLYTDLQIKFLKAGAVSRGGASG